MSSEHIEAEIQDYQIFYLQETVSVMFRIWIKL